MGSHNSRTFKHSQELYKPSLSFFGTHTHTHACTHTRTCMHLHTHTHMHPQSLSQDDAEVLTVSLFRVMRPPTSCLWPLALPLLVCDSACKLWSLTTDSDSMHITADHNLMKEIFTERKETFMKTTEMKWSTDLEDLKQKISIFIIFKLLWPWNWDKVV